MALEVVDYVLGSLSLTFVIISVFIGLTILSKYPKFKSRLYILIGLTWLGLATLFMSDSISFLMNIIIQESLSKELYFIIENVFVPIALICWIIAFTDMLGKKEQRLAIILILIYSVIFEVIFFILFFIDIDLIGVIDLSRPFSADYGIFLTVFLLISTIILLVTGLKFTQKSVKSPSEEIRLKGKLLRVAFITFTIATVLEKTARSIMLGLVFDDPSTPLLSVMLVIVRVLLIISAFAFYGGFLLPRWMHAILSKSKTE